MKRLSVALLSFAHPHALQWARALKESTVADLTVVWDDDPSRGQEAAEQFEARFDEDLSRTLATPGLDAVGISTVTSKHAETARAAARAGKHILCEKPMAATLEECESIRQAVETNGVLYMQAFPKRFDPINIEAKRIIEQGRIGAPTFARVRHGHGSGLTPRFEKMWFVRKADAGKGAFLDEGVHGADLLRWFFGDPLEVSASIHTLSMNIEVDDTGVAVYTFPGRLIAELASSWTWPAGTNTVEVFGTRGTLIIQGTDGASRDMTGADCLRVYSSEDGEDGWQTIDVPCGFKSDMFQGRVMLEFVRCLSEGLEIPVTMDDGIGALSMILNAYRAADLKAAVGF